MKENFLSYNPDFSIFDGLENYTPQEVAEMNRWLEELKLCKKIYTLTPEFIRSVFAFEVLKSFGVIWIDIDRRGRTKVAITRFGETVRLFDEYNKLRSKRKTITPHTKQIIEVTKLEKKMGDVHVQVKGDMTNSQFAINSSNTAQEVYSRKRQGNDLNKSWYQRHKELIALVGVIAAVAGCFLAFLAIKR